MRSTCVRAGAAAMRTSTAWPADRCARRCPSRSATRSAGSASSIRWEIIRSRTTPRRWRNTARCSNRSCSASCGRKSAAWRWVLRAVRQLFAGGSGPGARAARTERGISAEPLFRRRGRAVPQLRARQHHPRPAGRRRRLQERPGTHVPLGYRGYAAGAGGGGPSLRPLGFRAGPGARAAVAGPRRGAGGTRRTTISTSWRRPPCCGMAATMSKAIS